MEQKTMPNQAELQEEVVLGDRDELLLFHLKAEEKEKLGVRKKRERRCSLLPLRGIANKRTDHSTE